MFHHLHRTYQNFQVCPMTYHARQMQKKKTSETRRWNPTSCHILRAFGGSQNLEARRGVKTVITGTLSSCKKEAETHKKRHLLAENHPCFHSKRKSLHRQLTGVHRSVSEPWFNRRTTRKLLISQKPTGSRKELLHESKKETATAVVRRLLVGSETCTTGWPMAGQHTGKDLV